MLPEFMNLLRKFYFMRAAARNAKRQSDFFDRQKPQTFVCGFVYVYLALLISVAFFNTICAVYVYDADCSGNHTRVLFPVVCNRGVNILLQLLHAVFVRDAAEYRFTDDFSVPVDNIGGRE